MKDYQIRDSIAIENCFEIINARLNRIEKLLENIYANSTSDI